MLGAMIVVLHKTCRTSLPPKPSFQEMSPSTSCKQELDIRRMRSPRLAGPAALRPPHRAWPASPALIHRLPPSARCGGTPCHWIWAACKLPLCSVILVLLTMHGGLVDSIALRCAGLEPAWPYSSSRSWHVGNPDVHIAWRPEGVGLMSAVASCLL